MAAHVRHQGALLEKFLVADDAAVGLLAVKAAVVDQFELSSESRPTVATNEGIERAVKARVHNLKTKRQLSKWKDRTVAHQVVLLGEGLAALLAHVGPLPRVEFTVRGQVALDGKSLSAL